MTEAATATDAQTLEQLQSLEERILGAIRLLNDARQGRQHAEAEASRLRSDLQTRDAEIATLRKERDEVRRRVEKLLGQLNSLAE